MADSTITLVGALGADPELRFTTGGKGVTSFNMAVSRRWKSGDDWKEETSWFSVTAWDQLGENAAQSLSKGTRVIVTGRIQQESYETKEGEKRTTYKVIADAIGPDLRWATAQVEKVVREKQYADGPEPGEPF
jgi:single-strand DNA-binding protein